MTRAIIGQGPEMTIEMVERISKRRPIRKSKKGPSGPGAAQPKGKTP